MDYVFVGVALVLLIYGWLCAANMLAQREKQSMNLALTCRKCGRLAFPIPGTGNRYRCTCGGQFAGSKHPM